MSIVIIFHPTEQRKEQLRRDAELNGVTMSEYLRRMMDYCGQERVKNEMFPHNSGRQIDVR